MCNYNSPEWQWFQHGYPWHWLLWRELENKQTNTRCNWDKLQLCLGFPGSSAGKESACNARDPSSIPGSGRSPREGIGYPLQYSWASLVAQMVKNLLVTWEIWVWYLGQEDPLEKGMATHSLQYSCLENPRRQRSLAGYSPWGLKGSDITKYSTGQLCLNLYLIS